MNNEQFFKAIDGIDDKLLKGVYEDSSEDLSEELPDAESQHGAVYRLEHKPLSWKTFAGAAAALAVAVGAGFAVKAGLDRLSVSPDSVYSDGAAEGSQQGGDYSDSENAAGESQSRDLSYGCGIAVAFSEDKQPDDTTKYLEITEPRTVTAFLKTTLSPDPKMPNKNVPYRIFAFADGKPIEYAPESTEDYALWHDFYLSDNINYDNFDELAGTEKINFKADETTRSVTFVASFFPEYYQPEEWIGYRGVISIAAINTAADLSETELPEPPARGEYLSAVGSMKDYTFNLFKYYEKGESYIFREMEYSADDTLIMQFNVGESSSDKIPYYLFLLIDGEPQPIFDGDYTLKVDNQDGTRLFQYEIASGFLPEAGQHTVQAVAFPADETLYHHIESTYRIRARATKGEDPNNENKTFWHVQSHGFDDLDHYSYRADKDYTFIRVPDGMLEEYDFTNVGIGRSMLSILYGDVKWYTFPEDENFRVALIDGEYVPFIDSEVCEDYGVPFIEYPDDEDVIRLTAKECGYMSGISRAVWESNTVEELEQALAECDPDHRIDRVVYYKNRDAYYNNIEMEAPSGVFIEGMCIQVYWDGYEMHYDRKVSNSDWRDFVYPDENGNYPEPTPVTVDEFVQFEYQGEIYGRALDDWKAPGAVYGEYDFTEVGNAVDIMAFENKPDAEIYEFPKDKNILVAKIDGEYVPYVHRLAYLRNILSNLD